MQVFQSNRLSSRDISRDNVKVTEESLLRSYLELLSHDFITPLTIIKINLYLLERSAEAHSLHCYVEKLKDQSRHLQILFDELAAMLRLDLNIEQSADAPFHIDDVLEELIGSCQFEARQKGIHLVFCPPERTNPALCGNARNIRRAVANIIDNAIHHTPSGGCILVRCLSTDTDVVIHVQDNGSGISLEKLPFIFDRFYRGDESRSASMGNLGLGLPISRAIVHEHGGHILVETVYGYGTSFFVHLPILK